MWNSKKDKLVNCYKKIYYWTYKANFTHQSEKKLKINNSNNNNNNDNKITQAFRWKNRVVI